MVRSAQAIASEVFNRDHINLPVMPQMPLYSFVYSLLLSRSTDWTDRTQVVFLGLTGSKPVTTVETQLTFSEIGQPFLHGTNTTDLTDLMAINSTLVPVVNGEMNTGSTKIISQQSTPPTEASPQPLEEYPQTQQPVNTEVSYIPVWLWGLLPILLLVSVFSTWMLRDRSSNSKARTQSDRGSSVSSEPKEQPSVTSNSTTQAIAETHSVPETSSGTQAVSVDEETPTLTPTSRDEPSTLEETKIAEINDQSLVISEHEQAESSEENHSEILIKNETSERTEEFPEVENQELKVSELEENDDPWVEEEEDSEVLITNGNQSNKIEEVAAVENQELKVSELEENDFWVEEEDDSEGLISNGNQYKIEKVAAVENQELTVEEIEENDFWVEEEDDSEGLISNGNQYKIEKVAAVENQELTVEEIEENDFWVEEEDDSEGLISNGNQYKIEEILEPENQELTVEEIEENDLWVEEEEELQESSEVTDSEKAELLEKTLLDSQTEEQESQAEKVSSEEGMNINSAIAETVNGLEEEQMQALEEEQTIEPEPIANLSDREERLTQSSTQSLTETGNVALTGAVVSSMSEDSWEVSRQSEDIDHLETAAETSEAIVEESLPVENLEIENISAATSDTLDSAADSSTRVGGATAGMAFPEINKGSDSVSDSVSNNAQEIKQTADTISSMADVSQKQTETSPPETATVSQTSDQPEHLEVTSSVAESLEEETSLSDNQSWIILQLHDPENLYAYWNVVSEDREKLREKGGQQFALRFYDVTFIDMDVQKPHNVQEYECEESAKELYIHVPMKERDYIVEIGYVTEKGRWLKLVRSSHIHFPWDFPWPEELPEPTDETEDSAEEEQEETTTEPTDEIEPSVENEAEETDKITEVEQPQIQSDLEAIATEEVEAIEASSISVENQTVDENIILTETVERKTEFETDSPKVEATETVNPLVDNSVDNVDKIETSPIETEQLEEPKTTTSASIYEPLTPATETFSTANNTPEEPFSDEKTQSDIAATKFNLGQSDTAEKLAAVDEGLPSLPGGYGETKIVLLPIDPNWVYVYWDIPNEDREKLRQQGGKQLALRVCDVTEIDLETQNPHSVEYYECDELAREWHIPVPMSDRDYLVEIGYITNDKRWLMLARSLHVRVPPIYPSDREDYQQRTVTWEENLRRNFFFNLRSDRSPLSFLETTMQMFNNPFSNPMPS